MYKVIIAKHFEKQIKFLKKKFFHVNIDVAESLDNFDENLAINIGKNVYKIRIKSTDMNRGKSGSFRCYILLIKIRNIISPICIYAKNDQETLQMTELNYHLELIKNELLQIFED